MRLSATLRLGLYFRGSEVLCLKFKAGPGPGSTDQYPSEEVGSLGSDCGFYLDELKYDMHHLVDLFLLLRMHKSSKRRLLYYTEASLVSPPWEQMYTCNPRARLHLPRNSGSG